jgi:uncharacterized protein YycO
MARRLIRSFVVALVLAALVIWGWLRLTDATAADLKDLKRGDIVFQTSSSNQSLAILLASRSKFSHMGIVDFESDGKAVVLEASATARATPLVEWVRQGVGGRVAVYRMRGLTAEQAEKAAQAARSYFGRKYDLFFFDGDDELYCSEFVFLAFRNGAGVNLGQYQSMGSLDLDNFASRKVIAARWQKYPLCANGKAPDLDACLAVIRQQRLITPASIAGDPNLELVFSNYPASGG